MEQSTPEMSKNEKRMATKGMASLIFFNSLPPIIGMFVNAMYNVVDRYWVSQMGSEVGEAGITAIGITNPITIVLLGLCQLIGIGAATRVSIYLGQNNRDKAEKVLGNTFSSALILSFFYALIILLTKSSLLYSLGADTHTYQYADDYITIIILGCVFQMISFSMNHPIRATGNSVRFAMTQLVGAIANMVLDPILIFGLNMGIKGAAIATITAQAISATFAVSYYFSKRTDLTLKLKNLLPKKEIIISIVTIGFSPFTMQVASSLLTILLNKSLYFYSELEFGSGNIAITTMTIINSVSMMFLMPILGINQGSQPVIGFNFGMKDYKRVKSAYKWSVIYASIVCFAGFIIVELFAPFFINIFKPSPKVLELGTLGIRIFFITTISLGFQVPTVNFFQSIGKAKMAVFLSLLRQIFLLAPLYVILPRFFGVIGIIYAVPIADYTSALVTLYFIRKEMRELYA